MSTGIVTVIVAVVFAAIGTVLGIFISKSLSKKGPKEEELSRVKDRVEGISERVSLLVEEIRKKLDRLTAEKVEELREEVKELLSEIDRLKESLKQLNLSESSLEALGRTEALLKELKLNVPEFDSSLLTQIKDNLLILRNDVETKLSRRRETPSLNLSLLDSAVESVNTAIGLSKKINLLLVKGELSALASSFKDEELSSLVKEIDSQTLASKELVLLLEGVKKKLEEVRDEATLRRR